MKVKNSRLKMVKRAMFGRCSHELLEEKMLLYLVYYCYYSGN